MPNSNLESRSEEVQEIIGQVPPWIVRWGTTSIFLVVLTILTISSFVKYPDLIRGSALITTNSAPVELLVKQSGELTLIVSDNDEIKRGDELGFIRNTARFGDVLALESWLNGKEKIISDLNLGDIQNSFSKYLLLLNEWSEQINNQPELKEVIHLENQIRSLNNLGQNLTQQYAVFKNELKIEKNKLTTDSILHSQKVISTVDFNRSKTNLLQKKRALKAKEAEAINNNYKIIELEKQINGLEIEGKRIASNLKQELKNSKNELEIEISQWKQKFVFTAPIDGKVSFMNFIQNNQYLTQGVSLFTIIPSDKEFYARVKIPINSSGKVKVKQKVNIRLDNYPSQEFGVLNGEVSKIALIPNDELKDNEPAYTVIVSLPDGLITSYNHKLPDQQFLTGQMEVITENRTILDRIFNKLTSLLTYSS